RTGRPRLTTRDSPPGPLPRGGQAPPHGAGGGQAPPHDAGLAPHAAVTLRQVEGVDVDELPEVGRAWLRRDLDLPRPGPGRGARRSLGAVGDVVAHRDPAWPSTRARRRAVARFTRPSSISGWRPDRSLPPPASVAGSSSSERST